MLRTPSGIKDNVESSGRNSIVTVEPDNAARPSCSHVLTGSASPTISTKHRFIATPTVPYLCKHKYATVIQPRSVASLGGGAG